MIVLDRHDDYALDVKIGYVLVRLGYGRGFKDRTKALAEPSSCCVA